jgi:hypothetical protein
MVLIRFESQHHFICHLERREDILDTSSSSNASIVFTN